MTYNWNNMVPITVPTGTNGWLYSGEVIINGVKVRFPVGVPTSVPEPAAVLLKKMIELEQEEDANTAKPQNHYVGDVTIPAGKTLTIEKGAKFVDNSGPSEVVILPETELTVMNISDDGGKYMLTTPFENKPTGGSTCKFMWGGVEYTSPVVDATAVAGAPSPLLVFGNTDMMGFTEMLGSNPAPDAPFFGMMYPDGMEEDGIIQYLLFAASGDIVADPPVLSIVQIVGEESDDASGILTVKCVPSTSFIDKTTTITGADKSFSEVAAAYMSGKLVRFIAQYRSESSNCDFVGEVCYAGYENGAVNVLTIEFPMNIYANEKHRFGFNADGFTLLN